MSREDYFKKQFIEGKSPNSKYAENPSINKEEYEKALRNGLNPCTIEGKLDPLPNTSFSKEAVESLKKQAKDNVIPIRRDGAIIGIVDSIDDALMVTGTISGKIKKYHWAWHDGRWIKMIDEIEDLQAILPPSQIGEMSIKGLNCPDMKR